MIRLALTLVLMAGTAQAQASNAARYLVRENLEEACNGGPGEAGPGSIFEEDFDADGKRDLMIVHEMITCRPEDSSHGRSSLCGMQVCTVRLYLRRGSLLSLQEDFLGGGVSVNTAATPPIVSGYAHGGATWSFRWRDGAFR